MKDYGLLRPLAKVGDDLDSCGTGADDANPLVLELFQPTTGIASGIFVVPTTRMEAVTFVRFDATETWQLRSVQRAGRGNCEPCSNFVSTVGLRRCDAVSAEELH